MLAPHSHSWSTPLQAPLRKAAPSNTRVSQSHLLNKIAFNMDYWQYAAKQSSMAISRAYFDLVCDFEYTRVQMPSSGLQYALQQAKIATQICEVESSRAE